MIGLDALDKKILSFIDKNPSHPSEISRALKTKRTTISYRLKRLRNFGMAQSDTVGKKSVFKTKFKGQGSKTHIQTYFGDDMLNAYRELFNLPKNTVALSIQGSGAIRGELAHLPQSFIMEAHRIFKRRRIVLKGFSNKESLKALDELGRTMIQSHIGRSVGAKILNNDMFIGDGEVISTKNLLILANPVAKKVVVIKNSGITEIIHDTINLLFDMFEGTSSFDINSHLTKAISNK